MERVINFGLVSDPRNWIIIFLVLVFWAVAAKIFVSAMGGAILQIPGTGS